MEVVYEKKKENILSQNNTRRPLYSKDHDVYKYTTSTVYFEATSLTATVLLLFPPQKVVCRSQIVFMRGSTQKVVGKLIRWLVDYYNKSPR